ncbi:endolytic transglycosylase MltG [Caproicibacterium sp. NSD3]
MRHKILLSGMLLLGICLSIVLFCGCQAEDIGLSSSGNYVKVTIPSGNTFEQTADLLDENGICSKEEFYMVCESYEPQTFTIPDDPKCAFRMEGYLFPSSYLFQKGENAEMVLTQILKAFETNAGDLSEDELTLASLVQKETKVSDEMQMIAGTLQNRLDSGMRLQLDSTRVYADSISQSSLLSHSEDYQSYYNTNRKRGLPQGPICSPSVAAIDAVRNPAGTDALYFFFGNDGKSHYSNTFEEHLKAMEKYGVQSLL